MLGSKVKRNKKERGKQQGYQQNSSIQKEPILPLTVQLQPSYERLARFCSYTNTCQVHLTKSPFTKRGPGEVQMTKALWLAVTPPMPALTYSQDAPAPGRNYPIVSLTRSLFTEQFNLQKSIYCNLPDSFLNKTDEFLFFFSFQPFYF